ncbi:MAG: putative glycosyltransferase [Bacteroidetes bacterium]|nr:putative glycosyltransferase [Bacteroidota bacterium]
MDDKRNKIDETNINSPLGVRGVLNLFAANLFSSQLSSWPLARTNFEGLKTVRTKSFSFGDYEVRVQFNPARIVSSGAKVDAKTIAERKCFLCAANRPAEQKSVDFGDYEILVNPFPIFPEHFTIPHKEHIPQQIKPYFADMLLLAQAMDDYLVFYNGPQCGASAPDHLHFQAGTKDFLPLVNDYKRLKDTHTDLLVTTEKMQLLQLKNYSRTVYIIETAEIESAEDAFAKLYNHFSSANNELSSEPMMNLISMYENGKWYVFIIPRKAFRPWQYVAREDEQLLISPATVELGGVFVTPVEEHFKRITLKDIESILQQVSF